MTGAGERQASSAAPSRLLLEDLALLLVALLLLIVPALWRGAGGGAPREELRGLRPVRIDINAAPWHEWVLLDGIGEARARAIVAFRERRGGFAAIEDLVEVPGLPGGWLDQARPLLELGKPAPTAEPSP